MDSKVTEPLAAAASLTAAWNTTPTGRPLNRPDGGFGTVGMELLFNVFLENVSK